MRKCIIIFLTITISIWAKNVGFDVDDTLLFSTPAFKKAFESKGIRPFSNKFFALVNSYDAKYSKVKVMVKQIVKNHLRRGDTVYVITARKSVNTKPLKEFINRVFGIPQENIFFEPHGKVDRMIKLKLDVFYGDSDSDMRDAILAGARPIRIKRSKESSYKKKYHPGMYNELIVEGSEK